MAYKIQMDQLVKPREMPLEEALKLRHSKRSGWKNNVSFEEISCFLWAAYGKTEGHRHTVPSAGATYPLEMFVLAKSVGGVREGIYRYFPDDHTILQVKAGDFSEALGKACGKYSFVRDAPACIIIAADFSRTMSRYGERGKAYVYMEAGSAYQNAALEAVSLGLGTVVVGAFDDDAVKEVLDTKFEPLCVLPIG